MARNAGRNTCVGFHNAQDYDITWECDNGKTMNDFVIAESDGQGGDSGGAHIF